MSAVLRPFRIPGFARLVFTYTVNEVADWLTTIALSVLVYDATKSPLATTALFLAVKFVPGLLVAPLAGHLERFAPARLIGGLYLVEAAMFATIAATASTFLLPVVLALALAGGVASAVGRSVTRSATVALLEREGALREGNAALNIGFSVMNAVGPIAAGLLVAAAGAGRVVAIAAGISVLEAIVMGTARGLRPGPSEPAPWQAKLREAIDYVRSDPTRLALLGGQAGVLLLLTMVTPIEVVYAKETLDAGDAGLGALLTAWGVGMVAGSAVFARERNRSLRSLIVLSTLAMAAGYLGMAAASSLAAACVASALGGIGNGVQWVAVVTALQEATEERFQARVAGLLEATMALAPGAGFLIGGAITALLSPRAAFAASGGGVLLVLAVGATVVARRSVSLGRAEMEPEPEPARG